MPRIYNPSDQPVMSKKQSTGPLEDAVICLSGNLSKPKAAIDNHILKLGGSVVSTVTQTCTHLISTPFEFEALTSKVMTAISKGVPVVSEEWLTACEQAGDLADTEHFAIQSASPPTPSPPKKSIPTPVAKPIANVPGGGSLGKSLSGITLCCSGSLSRIRRDFHKFCSQHGAGIALSVTARTTHLVTTECEADNPTRKVLEAMNRQTPIVCEAFIHACIAAGEIVDDTPYMLVDHGVTSNNASSDAISPKKTPAKPLSTAAQNSKKRNMIASARSSGAVVALTSNASSEAAARLVMLANKFEPKRLKDPTGWWISEKLDGVRAYWDGQNFYSRNGNQFPCPDWFKVGLPKEPLDGELWCGRRQFRRCLSIVRNRSSGELWKFVTYLVFDVPSMHAVYEQRIDAITQHVSKASYAAAVGTIKCNSSSHLTNELKMVQSKGGEGLMLRQPRSMYDTGNRSNTLLKVKTQHDEEAQVVGHEGGKGRNAYRLGALTLKTPDGREFSCGSGLTDSDRSNPAPIGSVVTYRYTELMDNGYPRFPVFVSPRDDIDWDDYAANYSPPSKNSFVSGELQREHSIMYAPPVLHRSLSQKAESLNSPITKKSSAGQQNQEDEDTEEFDSEDEALNMALIASAKEHAVFLATKHEDSDTDLEEDSTPPPQKKPKNTDSTVVKQENVKEEEDDDDDDDDDTQTYMEDIKVETKVETSSTAVIDIQDSESQDLVTPQAKQKKRKKNRTILLESDSDSDSGGGDGGGGGGVDDDKTPLAATKKEDNTPDTVPDLGLSPDEMRRLKRMEAGMCTSCGILEASSGYDTCCRGCALGRGCSCSPPPAPLVSSTTNDDAMADDEEPEDGDYVIEEEANDDEDEDGDYDDDDDDEGKPQKKKKNKQLTRSRSEKLADEMGMDIGSVRQMLSENDQAEGLRSSN